MKYFTKDGEEYIPRLGDILSGEVFYIMSGETQRVHYTREDTDFKPLKNKYLEGLSFNSFYALMDREDWSYGHINRTFVLHNSRTFIRRKENETLEEFFLRIAIETGLLIIKPL